MRVLRIALAFTWASVGTIVSAGDLVAVNPNGAALDDVRPAATSVAESSERSGLKRLLLTADGTVYLSLAGEIRERYEYYNQPFFGVRGLENDSYLLHRILLSFDLHGGDHFRFFLQLGNHLETGKYARSPTDVDELDVQQVFIDLGCPLSPESSARFRVGRQELFFGSARLVGNRDGPNVRRSFDGARLTFSKGDATVDAFVTRTVRLKSGAFNDEPEKQEAFWGVYGVAPFPLLPNGHIDLYYLGLERDDAPFQQGIADEQRHSFGVRLWGKASGWDYNFEALVQTGSFGSDDILAWTFASDTGYTFHSLPFTPRIGLKADIASGDSDPSDKRLGTFNALFPKQPYFSEASLLAPANLIDVHPSLSFSLHEKVMLTTDVDVFWKHEAQDAIYAPPGRPLISAGKSNSRYSGTQVNAQLQWEVTQHLAISFYYSHFFAGPAVTGAGGRDADFAGTWITLRF